MQRNSASFKTHKLTNKAVLSKAANVAHRIAMDARKEEGPFSSFEVLCPRFKTKFHEPNSIHHSNLGKPAGSQYSGTTSE